MLYNTIVVEGGADTPSLSGKFRQPIQEVRHLLLAVDKAQQRIQEVHHFAAIGKTQHTNIEKKCIICC